jgi:hypothetical protein
MTTLGDLDIYYKFIYLFALLHLADLVQVDNLRFLPYLLVILELEFECHLMSSPVHAPV